MARLLSFSSTLLHFSFLPLTTIHIIHKHTLTYHTCEMCLLIVCFPLLGCKLPESRDLGLFFAVMAVSRKWVHSKYLPVINCLE